MKELNEKTYINLNNIVLAEQIGDEYFIVTRNGNRLNVTAPQYVIKFSKDDEDHWYTVWDKGIICKYNGEKKPVRAMRPYLDEVYSADIQKTIIDLFDKRCFHYRNLITFKQFQQDIELLKPRT